MIDNLLINTMFEKLNRIRHNFDFSTYSQLGDFRITCVGLSLEEVEQLKQLGVYVHVEIPDRDKITYHFHIGRPKA